MIRKINLENITGNWVHEKHLYLTDIFLDDILPFFKKSKIYVKCGIRAMHLLSTYTYLNTPDSIVLAGCEIFFKLDFNLNPYDIVATDIGSSLPIPR